MTHHSNYIPEENKAEIEMMIEANAINGPAFVGCGWTKQVGSDCYGGYCVNISKTAKGKPLVGLVHAHTEMGPNGWTAGDELCSLPDGKTDPSECTPTEWITTFGKYKDGSPKWYFCDSSGKRFIPGRHCNYRFGAALSYRNPSF